MLTPCGFDCPIAILFTIVYAFLMLGIFKRGYVFDEDIESHCRPRLYSGYLQRWSPHQNKKSSLSLSANRNLRLALRPRGVQADFAIGLGAQILNT